MTKSLFCIVEGEWMVFAVEIEEGKAVAQLKEVIKEKKPSTIKCDADALNLFLTRRNGNWLVPDDPDKLRSRSDEILGGIKQNANKMYPWKLIGNEAFSFPNGATEDQVHVLVELPKSATAADNKVLYGAQGSPGIDRQGINLSNPKNLPRTALVNSIIRDLDKLHAVLIKSPPMTGKTSVAALICRELEKRFKDRMKAKVKVFSFTSLLVNGDNDTFVHAFKRQCMIDWEEVTSLPSQGFTVYLVLDEVQGFYKTATSSPRYQSDMFWRLVKAVQNDAMLQYRILMLGAYGSDLMYTTSVTPVEFGEESLLGIDRLNFCREEIKEYVNNWFSAKECLGNTMEAFCDHLQILTGGHVGLCVAAIEALNTMRCSRVASGRTALSAHDWIRLLQEDSLDPRGDYSLVDTLALSRGVNVLNTLTSEELCSLEALAYGKRNGSSTEDKEKFIRKGILVKVGRELKFSSPVMGRYFFKLRVGHIERAQYGPENLADMIKRIIQSINYDNIRNTLGRSLSSDIPLERAWQMEFYKASYRCTPHSFMTSADVGAVFQSRGFVDFTIHCEGALWGIELLREGNRLEEHLQRFALAGKYSSVPLSDYCLLDFRCVSDDTTKRASEEKSSRHEKLFVVCYDEALTQVSVLNRGSVWLQHFLVAS